MGIRGMRTGRHFGVSVLCLSALLAGPSLVHAGGRPASLVRGGGIGFHHLRSAPGQLAFVFGREGGNGPSIRATITNGGSVVSREPGSVKRFRLQPAAAAGLLKLAEAVGFFRGGQKAACAGPPVAAGDISTAYIIITTTPGTTDRSSPGDCSSGFAQLNDVLWAVGRL